MDKYIRIILGTIILVLIGFLLGRCTDEVKTVTTVKYIKGKTITDSIKVPTLITESIPAKPIYIIKSVIKDSVTVQVVDTSEILKDWTIKRSYREVVLDNDTTGKLEINADVQYNRLQKLGYSFTPVEKIIESTIVKNPKLELLGGVGATLNGALNCQVGILKNHLGVTYMYTRDNVNNRNYHGLNVLFRY